MLETIRNVFAIPDLRQRLLFTFGLLVVYRVGCNVPLPGLDLDVLRELMAQAQGSLLGLVNVFSGGSLKRAAVFALGIMPYVTASIVLQLLTVTVPHLEKLKREGELGRRKITQYTRYLTLVIAVIQSTSVAFTVESLTSAAGAHLVPHPGWGFRCLTALTLTAGCAFVMWLGEQITERGIGNGISLLICAGILAAVPGACVSVYTQVKSGSLHPATVVALAAFLALLTRIIVHVERIQRRIPVQYARRVAGREVHGGQSSYLPLRVNMAGVIPVIFASSVLVLPRTLAGLAPQGWTFVATLTDALSPGQPLYYLLQATAIVGFSFLYVAIVFNPQDTADHLRRQGSFIPGIRAGRPTAEHLDRVVTRLTWVGGLYLAGVVIVPELLVSGLRVESIPWIGSALDALLPLWMTAGVGIDFSLGGTSLLIVVSVAMDFVRQVDGQLVMHRYESFFGTSRNGGRRHGSIVPSLLR